MREDDEALARDDWDGHWSEKAATNALNPAQAFRRDIILRLLALENAPAPVRWIDLGCGSGELAKYVTTVRSDIEVLGLDGSATGVELARRKVPMGRFFQHDLESPTPVDGFDGWATHGVCTEVLEHMDHPTRALVNVRPLLAPDCKLVITVPAGPMSAFDRHLGHRRHFTPRLLRETIEAAGFRVLHVEGAGFPFFNLYRLAVVLRGARVIDDAKSTGTAELPPLTRAAIRLLGALFPWSAPNTTLGWQLVAVATLR